MHTPPHSIKDTVKYNYDEHYNTHFGPQDTLASLFPDPDEQEELLGDLQEGIQADDEDNDQIETERAMGNSDQRKSEFH